MPMPFLRRFFPVQIAEGQAERLIDNEYQLARFSAEDTHSESLQDYLKDLLDMQRDTAIRRVRELSTTEKKSGPFRALLDLLTAPQPTGTPAFVPEDILIQDMAATKTRLEERGLAIEAVLQKQQPTSVTDPSTSKDVQTEAARALKNGMASTGRDQQEEFKDALHLFREAQGGAIGGRNYVVWFQIGWILWKHKADLAGAEEAFYQAYRLSASQNDIFYYLSLRHRAYLQFLQGQVQEARATIARAVSTFDTDGDTLLDAARYAAAAGETAEAISLLSRLLVYAPSLAVTLLADEAFTVSDDTATAIISSLVEQTAIGEKKAAAAVDQLVTAEKNIVTAQDRIGVEINLPEALIAGIPEAVALLRRHTGALHYPTSVGIQLTAATQSAAIYAYAQNQLDEASTAIQQRLFRPRRQIERLRNEQLHWKEDSSKLERSARRMNVKLGAPPKRGLFGGFNPEHVTLFDNYQHARTQLEITDKAIATEVPVYEADITKGEQELKQIVETQDWLKGEVGIPPVS